MGWLSDSWSSITSTVSSWFGGGDSGGDSSPQPSDSGSSQYQGPTRPGTDESHFRETGESRRRGGGRSKSSAPTSQQIDVDSDIDISNLSNDVNLSRTSNRTPIQETRIDVTSDGIPEPEKIDLPISTFLKDAGKKYVDKQREIALKFEEPIIRKEKRSIGETGAVSKYIISPFTKVAKPIGQATVQSAKDLFTLGGGEIYENEPLTERIPRTFELMESRFTEPYIKDDSPAVIIEDNTLKIAPGKTIEDIEKEPEIIDVPSPLEILDETAKEITATAGGYTTENLEKLSEENFQQKFKKEIDLETHQSIQEELINKIESAKTDKEIEDWKKYATEKGFEYTINKDNTISIKNIKLEKDIEKLKIDKTKLLNLQYQSEDEARQQILDDKSKMQKLFGSSEFETVLSSAQYAIPYYGGAKFAIDSAEMIVNPIGTYEGMSADWGRTGKEFGITILTLGAISGGKSILKRYNTKIKFKDPKIDVKTWIKEGKTEGITEGRIKIEYTINDKPKIDNFNFHGDIKQFKDKSGKSTFSSSDIIIKDSSGKIIGNVKDISQTKNLKDVIKNEIKSNKGDLQNFITTSLAEEIRFKKPRRMTPNELKEVLEQGGKADLFDWYMMEPRKNIFKKDYSGAITGTRELFKKIVTDKIMGSTIETTSFSKTKRFDRKKKKKKGESDMSQTWSKDIIEIPSEIDIDAMLKKKKGKSKKKSAQLLEDIYKKIKTDEIIEKPKIEKKKVEKIQESKKIKSDSIPSQWEGVYDVRGESQGPLAFSGEQSSIIKSTESSLGQFVKKTIEKGETKTLIEIPKIKINVGEVEINEQDMLDRYKSKIVLDTNIDIEEKQKELFLKTYGYPTSKTDKKTKITTKTFPKLTEKIKLEEVLITRTGQTIFGHRIKKPKPKRPKLRFAIEPFKKRDIFKNKKKKKKFQTHTEYSASLSGLLAGKIGRPKTITGIGMRGSKKKYNKQVKEILGL